MIKYQIFIAVFVIIITGCETKKEVLFSDSGRIISGISRLKDIYGSVVAYEAKTKEAPFKTSHNFDNLLDKLNYYYPYSHRALLFKDGYTYTLGKNAKFHKKDIDGSLPAVVLKIDRLSYFLVLYENGHVRKFKCSILKKN